jgi:MFS family permease
MTAADDTPQWRAQQATAGLVLGYVVLVVGIALIVAFLAVLPAGIITARVTGRRQCYLIGAVQDVLCLDPVQDFAQVVQISAHIIHGKPDRAYR